MPVQIDMEMPRSCGVCDCLYRHRDMTTGFCPFTGHFVNFGDGREVDCPLVEAKEQKWHVVAEGDLPEEVNKTYQCTVLDKFEKEIVLAEILYGTFVGFFCDTYLYDVLAWRELPEPWEGAVK